MAEAILEGATLRRVAPRGAEARAAPDTQEARRFAFTGSGTEYFRIWVVNLLLSILTLGIYSAWAKVRRMQYFHRNTVLDGAVFDYHGDPKVILKGRVLALVLLAAYQVSTDISAAAGIVVVVLLLAITPWLLARAFRFKMANTSYRGMRFRFRGTVGQAYRMLILFPVMLAVTGVFVWSLATTYARDPGVGVILITMLLPLGAVAGAVPLAHYFLKRYQHGNADYGQTPFFFHASAVDFFKIYGRAVGLVFLGVIPAGIFALATAGLFQFLQQTMFGKLFALLYTLLSVYVFYLLVRPYLESRLQNLVWNHTELGMHQFESRVRARVLLWIHASNLLLIALSLGLYKPFAAIRIARYRIESMAIVQGGSLDDFLADRSRDQAGALGQEAGDLFDIDIAI